MKDMNLASLRINYKKGELLEQNIGTEPFALFQLWIEDAKASEIKEALADEMADVLWVLVCLANQTGIDLTKAIDKNFNKKSIRDKNRHHNNSKLL